MGWLSGYQYRKKVTITGSSGAGQNYQVKLSIGSSSGGDFHLEGHCVDFPNDIRFTDDDGTTLLDYWIEDPTQDPITVWVKVKNNLDNNVDIYVYYGNPSASSASDGEATFEFFDDFDNLEDCDYFTKSVGAGVFQLNIAPTALHYNNKTFVVWRSDSGDPYINVYDHVTGEWAEDVKVGESNIPGDEHGAPSIVRDTNGYLHVFHGAHNSALQHEKSNNPDDITAWTSQSNIGSSASYPRVVLVGDTIYLFYRISTGGVGRPEIYRTSSDNGSTWSDENIIIEFSSSDWIYAGPVEVNGDGTQIHIAWAYYPGSGDYQNIYHAYLDLSDHHMYSMDGTDLGTKIDKTEADAHCLVYEGSGTYIPFVRLDSSGYPHITWTETSKVLKYTKWNGNGWDDITTIATDRFAVDFMINSDNDMDIYTRHDKAETYDAERWHWDGSSWSLADIIISDSDSKTKTLTVHNHHPDIAAIVGVNNDCLYAYGPNSGFTGNSLPSLDTEKWTVIQGNVSVSDSSLHLTGTTGTRGLIDGKTEIAQGAAIHARAKYAQANALATHFCEMRKSNDDNYKVSTYVRYSDGRLVSVTKDAGAVSKTDWDSIDTPTNWHIYKITWKSGEAKYYQDDAPKVTHTNNVPTTNLVAMFMEGEVSGGDVDIDWVFVRKFVSPEPSFSSAGNEAELTTISTSDEAVSFSVPSLVASHLHSDFALASEAAGMADFVSVQSGDWNDGATWGNNSPGVKGVDWPGNPGDTVKVSAGHVVTYNVSEANELGQVDIYGKLSFNFEGDRLLTLGHVNLIIHDGGELEIGTSGSNFPAEHTAEILFNPSSDNAVGLIVEEGGKLTVYGASNYCSDYEDELADDVENTDGDTVIKTKNDMSSIWHVGDELAIKVEKDGDFSSHTDAIKLGTIQSFDNTDGRLITLDVNITAESGVGNTWTAPVINVTRNVKFGKKNASTAIGDYNSNRPKFVDNNVEGNNNCIFSYAMATGFYSIKSSHGFQFNESTLRNSYRGFEGGVGHSISGNIYSNSCGIYQGTGHSISGNVFANHYGIWGGKAHEVIGNVYSNNIGFESGVEHEVSGNVFSNYKGFEFGSRHKISGNVYANYHAFSEGLDFEISGRIGYDNNENARPNVMYDFYTSEYQKHYLFNAKLPAAGLKVQRNLDRVTARIICEHHDRVLEAQRIYDNVGDVIKTACNGAGDAPSEDPYGGNGYCIELSNIQSLCNSNNPLRTWEPKQFRVWARAGVQRTYTFKVQTTYPAGISAGGLKLIAEYLDGSSGGSLSKVTSAPAISPRSSPSDWSQELSVTVTPAEEGWIDFMIELMQYDSGGKVFIWPSVGGEEMSYILTTSIPAGFKEDSKKFEVSSVGETPVAHQLTELEDADEYIIKEIRIFFNGTPSDDAYFHLNTASSDDEETRFAEGYYWEGSFRMFDGNFNGKINDTLTSKPYLFVCAGTGASAQTVYGSVRYYYK